MHPERQLLPAQQLREGRVQALGDHHRDAAVLDHLSPLEYDFVRSSVLQIIRSAFEILSICLVTTRVSLEFFQGCFKSL